MVSGESQSMNPLENWSVILQSYNQKKKKDFAKKFAQTFGLDKKDAAQAISNTPIIILDNLSFGVAMRVKKHFQELGAVMETTNYDMIKKNCYQIGWPETPDLSFFSPKNTEEQPVAEVEPQKNPFSIPAAKEAVETVKEDLGDAFAEEIRIDQDQTQDAPEAKEETVVEPPQESEWEQKARELSEKLQKIQEEIEKYFNGLKDKAKIETHLEKIVDAEPADPEPVTDNK